MKKLKTNIRTTEIDDTSDQLIAVYSKADGVKDDTFLKDTFEELKTLSSKITSAIKMDRAKSELEDADKVRDEQIYALSNVLKGYASMNIENLAQSGVAIKKVFDKYGTKIAKENYSTESSLIESLLMDLAAEEIKNDINALQGVQEAISSLRRAQDEFNKSRLTYDAAKAQDKEAQNATDLKKDILMCINDKIVTYLNAMIVSDAQKYGAFAAMIETEIERANATVSARTSKSAGMLQNRFSIAGDRL